MSPTRVAKLQKKAQYCHTRCHKLQGDCTGADQVERRADILGRQGQVATPAAFYLGLCRLRGNLSPPAPATVILQRAIHQCGYERCRRAIQYCDNGLQQAGYSTCRDDGAAVILDFRPRIVNLCNREHHSGDFRAAILDLRGSI